MRELLLKIKEKLTAFMAGRCGMDALGLAATALAFVLSLIARGCDSLALMLLALAALVYALWRCLSRQLEKRAGENQKFLCLTTKPRAFLSGWWQRLLQSRQYRFFVCPGCKNRLRVPRGKGSVQITCPRCGRSFAGRT